MFLMIKIIKKSQVKSKESFNQQYNYGESYQ